MKYLIILLVSLQSFADTPGPICDQVTLTVCKGEKAVVVKKNNKKKVVKKAEKPLPVIYVEDVIVEKRVEVIKVVNKTRKNVVFIYGQRKITDLEVKTGPNTAKVESQREAVLGLGYQRQFDSGLVLGAGVDTQGDVQGQIGIGF